jgi:L-ascorbate metabolism protein UlaG (beta-lactamase superfamily)
MRLIKFGHACVRLESDRGVLVIDPGILSDTVALDGADAVLVTHEHADHLNVEPIVAAVSGRTGVRVFTDAAVAPKLDAVAGSVTSVAPGERFEAAGYEVQAFGGTHARIHADIPPIANLAFLVDGLVYHPGDSLVVPEGTTVDTLLVPVSGPWLKAAEAIDFVRAVGPRQAVAIHDGLYNDFGLGLVDSLFSQLSRTEFHRLAAGGELTVGGPAVG